MTFHDVPHLEGGLSDGLDARLVNGLLQRVLAQAVQRLVDQHLQHTLDTKEGRTNSAAGPLSLLFTATFPKPRRTQHESGRLTCQECMEHRMSWYPAWLNTFYMHSIHRLHSPPSRSPPSPWCNNLLSPQPPNPAMQYTTYLEQKECLAHLQATDGIEDVLLGHLLALAEARHTHAGVSQQPLHRVVVCLARHGARHRHDQVHGRVRALLHAAEQAADGDGGGLGSGTDGTAAKMQLRKRMWGACVP